MISHWHPVTNDKVREEVERYDPEWGQKTDSKNRFRTDIAVTNSRQVPYNSHYNLISDVWIEK